jgi:hypothetical protein
LAAQSLSLPPNCRLYVEPMEWNLDRFVSEEIQRQGLPVKLVDRPEEAEFIMAAQYQSLGSHFLTPGHYIQVQIFSANAGRPVWSAEANDYGIFFARLRHHGPGRAAVTIVKRLRLNMAATATR